MVRLATLLAMLLSASVTLAAPPPRLSMRSAPSKGDSEAQRPLGLLLGAVPDLLYHHVPNLPKGHGLAVLEVESDSAGAKAGIKTHDILLSLDGRVLSKPEQFSEVLADKSAGKKLPLVLLRAAKEIALEITVPAQQPRGIAKPGAPMLVNVEAVPLGAGKVKVTFEYPVEGTGKLHRIACSGSLKEIEKEVQNLPPRVQDLAQVALKRMRELNFPKESER